MKINSRSIKDTVVVCFNPLKQQCMVFITVAMGVINILLFQSLLKCRYYESAANGGSVSHPYLLETIDKLSNEDHLAFVNFPYFGACRDSGWKVSCQTTILFNSHAVIPLKNISDSNQKDSVCLQVGARITPFVQVPVCIQNSDAFGALVYVIPSASVVVVVKNIQEKLVKEFIDQHVPNEARIVELKKIDFPEYYNQTNDRQNLVSERYRDNNYGNMVWRYSATTILNPVTTQIDRNDRHYELELLDGAVDVLVLATANALAIMQRPVLELFIEWFTKRIITRNVPTIVLGVGMQMDFNQKLLTARDDTIEENLFNTNVTFPHKFQIDFLQEVSKRQNIPSIGVRGDMTKNVCENSGIHNCVSMGCPSLTISREINLGRILEKNWYSVLERLKNHDKTLKIAITSPAYASIGKFISLCRLTLAYVLDEFGDHATMIEQTQYDWPELKNFIDFNWTTIRPESNMTSSSIKHIEFYNVESWIASAKEFDLCISFRIHGSTMFFNSGVPTLLIPTDFRIMELISAMKIPYLVPYNLQMALGSNSSYFLQANPGAGFDFLESLLNVAKNTNFTEFEVNRREKLSGWKSILNSVGLEMDPALLKVIDSPLEMH